MSEFPKENIIKNLIRSVPLILLFISVFNEIDLNYLEIFSLNFSFILIFFWSLRKTELLGYGYIFLAGLINDVVTGFPIGISSFNYLLICGFAAYLKTITLRPSMIKDWFFFLFTILVVNSLSYGVLNIFFSIDLNYKNLFFNIFFTFIFYIIFANLFFIYQQKYLKESN
ncbi:MAG: rod shape-determining protein MreD [Pelagibacteraceae bacterium]|jgi:rod shape-determining protein MreD|nr:rod shape-determining protein MreD [Pelagibacteraceae bacterium]|tara:strand:+ start:834 stop:1343 length:510 start_codon:yes stop_codon:yes gene_type:complete